MSAVFCSASTRSMRHCCSVTSCFRRCGRKRCMTDSRARINNIGKDLRKARISKLLLADFELNGTFLGRLEIAAIDPLAYRPSNNCLGNNQLVELILDQLYRGETRPVQPLEPH